jgi:hypothetical protein
MKAKSGLAAALIFGCISLAAQAQNAAIGKPCTIQATTCHGWSAQEMSNDWVQLIFVPELG